MYAGDGAQSFQHSQSDTCTLASLHFSSGVLDLGKAMNHQSSM